MAEVEYAKATRIYPGTGDIRAVDTLDLNVVDGEFLVLVGPSGSGKSTALRMAAGLETVDEGRLSIGGQDVSNLPPRERDIAMVFQNYALYPHMTVAENMGFALRLRKLGKEEISSKVADAAALLDLTDYLDRKPKALSGGQRQRVAMGRAIVREPAVFLMDEPLSNLDAKLRVETRANIAALQQRLGTTTIYVTHDQVEAMTMGDRVAVLRDGVLQQCATPRELYETPANVFVAGFIGSPAMNLFTLPLTDRGVLFGELSIDLPRDVLARAVDQDSELTVGIRPEALHEVGRAEPGADLRVDLVEELGADAYLHGFVPGHDERVVVRVAGKAVPRIGDTVRIGLRTADNVHAFETASGNRIVA